MENNWVRPRFRHLPRTAEWQPMSQQNFETMRRHYRYWKEELNAKDGDPGIMKILELLNQLPGVTTLYSCEGHEYRGKWFGFYLIIFVTEEGDGWMRQFEKEVNKKSAALPLDNFFILNYTTIPNPLSFSSDPKAANEPFSHPCIHLPDSKGWLENEFYGIEQKEPALQHFETALRKIVALVPSAET